MSSCVQSWNRFKSVVVNLCNLLCFIRSFIDAHMISAVCGTTTKASFKGEQRRLPSLACHGSVTLLGGWYAFRIFLFFFILLI